jgi:hypothetical protein
MNICYVRLRFRSDSPLKGVRGICADDAFQIFLSLQKKSMKKLVIIFLAVCSLSSFTAINPCPGNISARVTNDGDAETIANLKKILADIPNNLANYAATRHGVSKSKAKYDVNLTFKDPDIMFAQIFEYLNNGVATDEGKIFRLVLNNPTDQAGYDKMITRWKNIMNKSTDATGTDSKPLSDHSITMTWSTSTAVVTLFYYTTFTKIGPEIWMKKRVK